MSRSSIEIENSLREKIYSLLKQEILYKDIIEEIESTGMNELVRGQEKYRKQKNLLMIHVTGRDVPQRQRVSMATAVLTERERPLHPFPLQLPLGAVAAAVN